MREALFIKKVKEFIALIAIGFLLVLFYVSLEFVFLLSKVSFLSCMTLSELIVTFSNSILLVIIPIVLVLGVIYSTSIIFKEVNKLLIFVKYTVLLLFSFAFIFLIFSHIDTFVYSSFNRVNIAYLPLPVRIFVLLCLFVISIFFLKKNVISLFIFFCKHTKIISTLFTAIFILGALTFFYSLHKYGSYYVKIDKQLIGRLPNIIFFSSDELESERMGIYGATKDTTPNINEFAKSATVFNNAYANAYTSRGSVVSILSGKSPFTTKVIAQPSILMGKNSFQHLPGILQKMGYYCADFGPYDQTVPTVTNMLDGFDEVNGVRQYSSYNSFFGRLRKIYPVETYFLRSVFFNRIYEKLACMCGFMNTLSINIGIDMDTEPARSLMSDHEIIISVIKLIKNTDKPIFIHLHLSETHHDASGVATGQIEDEKKYIEAEDYRYDKALLDMDNLFGNFIKALKDNDK